MNHCTHHAKSDLSIQLKICEACGALWLRRAPQITAYCNRCTPILAALPAGRQPRRARHLVAVNPSRLAFVGGAR